MAQMGGWPRLARGLARAANRLSLLEHRRGDRGFGADSAT